MNFGEKFVGKFPEKKNFATFFPEISEKIVEKFSRNSPDTTFSHRFPERFPENTQKCRGKSRGEIFPSGSFPDFPKFSRREIFSTKFHHNVTNNLYTSNWLQPVNQPFIKCNLQYFWRKLLWKNSHKKSFRHIFSGNFGETRGEIFPKISRCNFFTPVYKAVSRKYPKMSGKLPGGNFPGGKFPGFPEILPSGNFLHNFLSQRY